MTRQLASPARQAIGRGDGMPRDRRLHRGGGRERVHRASGRDPICPPDRGWLPLPHGGSANRSGADPQERHDRQPARLLVHRHRQRSAERPQRKHSCDRHRTFRGCLDSDRDRACTHRDLHGTLGFIYVWNPRLPTSQRANQLHRQRHRRNLGVPRPDHLGRPRHRWARNCGPKQACQANLLRRRWLARTAAPSAEPPYPADNQSNDAAT
jgi:hypothetical protein